MLSYAKQFLFWPIHIISNLTPKDNNTWVFSAWIGEKYSDNSKYLFEYLVENEPSIKAYWVTKNSNDLKNLREKGKPCVYTYSIHGLIVQARAGVAVFTHSHFSEFLPAIIPNKVKRIQLWHGTPLKKIGSNVKGTFNKKYPLLSDVRNIIFPWMMTQDFSLFISASDEVTTKLKNAFESRTYSVTGYPRNDVMHIGDITNWQPKIKKIIYMPTFRGTVKNKISNTETCNIVIDNLIKEKELLDEWFENNEVKLILKMHPSNYPTLELSKKIDAIGWLEMYSGPDDIYESINEYDVLITDYSSIFFDFLLTGKPVIHAAFDMKNYVSNSRELYYNYNEVSIINDIETWKDITVFLSSIINSGVDGDYIDKYNEILNRFNRYKDNLSSKRVYTEISKLLD